MSDVDAGPVMALEPICAKCGEYFVHQVSQTDGFVEWRCMCRSKILNVRQDYPIYDKLFSSGEKSLYLNGFADFVRVQGFKFIETDISATVSGIREKANELKLSDVKSILIDQLKSIR